MITTLALFLQQVDGSWFDRLITVGGWFFLITVAVVAVSVFIAIANESLAPALFVTVGFLLLLWVGEDLASCYTYATENPKLVGLWIGIYVLAGFLWALFRWFKFAREKYRKYQSIRTDFLKGKNENPNLTAIPSALQEEWNTHLSRQMHPSEHGYGKGPSSSKYADKIALWIIYWPWDLVWYLLSDFLIEAAKLVQRLGDKFFRFVSSFAFRNSSADFKKEGE